MEFLKKIIKLTTCVLDVVILKKVCYDELVLPECVTLLTVPWRHKNKSFYIWTVIIFVDYYNLCWSLV